MKTKEKASSLAVGDSGFLFNLGWGFSHHHYFPCLNIAMSVNTFWNPRINFTSTMEVSKIQILKTLFNSEEKPGFPYPTWTIEHFLMKSPLSSPCQSPFYFATDPTIRFLYPKWKRVTNILTIYIRGVKKYLLTYISETTTGKSIIRLVSFHLFLIQKKPISPDRCNQKICQAREGLAPLEALSHGPQWSWQLLESSWREHRQRQHLFSTIPEEICS